MSGRGSDTDRPFRRAAVASLQQLDGIVDAWDHEEQSSGGQGAHDLGVRLESGGTVAVEVTRLIEGDVLATFEELRRGGRRRSAAVRGTWRVFFGDATARIKDMTAALESVISRLERAGITQLDVLTWTEHPPASLNWDELREVCERLERFSIYEVVSVAEDGSELQIEGPSFGGFDSAEDLARRVLGRAVAKAPQVRGRADESWVFVWVGWTELSPGRHLRPEVVSQLPPLSLPEGIAQVIASTTSFDVTEERLPLAIWRQSVRPESYWVRRQPVDRELEAAGG